MKIDYKLIGERIKKARLKKNWSQDKLSEEIDVTIAYISRVERGSSKVNLKRLSQICEALNIEMEELICGTTTSSKKYLDKDLYEIIINCTPEKQRLIYKIAKIVEKADNFEEYFIEKIEDYV